MSHEIQTDFRLFELDPQEQREAAKFTLLQEQWLQNMLGSVAHQKLNLKVDPNNFHSFLQEEAYLTGQMDLLRAILTPAQPLNTTMEF